MHLWWDENNPWFHIELLLCCHSCHRVPNLEWQKKRKLTFFKCANRTCSYLWRNRAIMANMPIQLILGKSKTGCTIFNPTQPIHPWTSGSCPSLMESEPVGLDRTDMWYVAHGRSFFRALEVLLLFLLRWRSKQQFWHGCSSLTFVSYGVLAHLQLSSPHSCRCAANLLTSLASMNVAFMRSCTTSLTHVGF